MLEKLDVEVVVKEGEYEGDKKCLNSANATYPLALSATGERYPVVVTCPLDLSRVAATPLVC